ncbi:hypothetical protein ACQRC6_04155 [Peptoniphilus sp. SGI.035]|uniref:hypothetical protein n=1 Tax=Peptoniphilus sp. SGI.035 TaxID=3420564 RepID=UPI003CFDF45D
MKYSLKIQYALRVISIVKKTNLTQFFKLIVERSGDDNLAEGFLTNSFHCDVL